MHEKQKAFTTTIQQPNANTQANKGGITMANTTKTWQEELRDELEALTPEQFARAHDFLAGYLAAMKDSNQSK